MTVPPEWARGLKPTALLGFATLSEPRPSWNGKNICVDWSKL